jgi:glycosyltransferase involved in cell wall biosynthesis
MEEVNMLKRCCQVFAISKEDTLLLSQFGIKATYLPYYPPSETLKSLFQIRKIRRQKQNKTKDGKKILLLGSVVNPPTKEGMKNRINFFNQQRDGNYEIIVAGFETDQLKSMSVSSGNIRFYGELTNEQLFNLLSEVDVLLIHQPATSGALTRIVETLIAGIPVLVNFTGARNYYGTDGVYIYNNDEQLVNYLSQDLPVPAIPDKPVLEFESFLIEIKY